MGQFHFDPDAYNQLMADEVPAISVPAPGRRRHAGSRAQAIVVPQPVQRPPTGAGPAL
jgi:hypothetical protein